MRPLRPSRFLATLTTPSPGDGIGFAVPLCVAYYALYEILGYIQFYHWLLAGGLLFSALWLADRRWWPWLFATTILARMTFGFLTYRLTGIHGPVLGYWANWTQWFLGSVPEAFLSGLGVATLHRLGVRPGTVVDARAIARLHVSALVSAIAVTAKDLCYVINDGFIADVTRGILHDRVPLGGPGSWELLLRFGIKNLMGGFVGVMLVAPFAMWIASPHARVRSREILGDVGRTVFPAAVLFLVLGTIVDNSRLAELLRLLLLAVVAVAAVRGGWREAALAVLMVSIAVAIDDHLGKGTANPIQLQLYIAICGAMGLMFGATVDDLHRQQVTLDTTQARAFALSEELASAASRNLQSEERERRRIAAELHDEFGQNLTALQTHLKLAHVDFAQTGNPRMADALLELTVTMRRNIAGILETLRPAGLHELGLFQAIDRSAIRNLAEDAGLCFETRIEGDARLLESLDDTHRVAAYRLVQEAVTNVVRHARATRCSVRLRINHRQRRLCVFIDVRDNGVGTADQLRAGYGLTGMRDRAMALDGKLHLHDLHPGLRIHALLRQGIEG